MADGTSAEVNGDPTDTTRSHLVIPPRQALGAVAVCAMSIGCTAEDRSNYLLFSEDARQRFETDVAFSEAWSWGSEGDTILMNPRHVAATLGGVFVFDDVSGRVIRFSEAGEPMWTFGGRGAGPSEFNDVRDMAVDQAGQLVLLDNGNRRITTLSEDGRAVARTPLPDIGYPDQIVPLADGGHLVFTYGVPSVVRISPAGEVGAAFDLPWEHFDALSAVERQGSIASWGDRWVFGFRLGDGWFSFEGTDSMGVHPYAEHTPFPLVRRETSGGTRQTRLLAGTCSGCSLSLTDDTLFVHFGGHSEDQYALVDRFVASTGEYVGTTRMPIRASSLTVGGGVVYALDLESLFPRLVAFSMSPGSSPARNGSPAP